MKKTLTHVPAARPAHAPLTLPARLGVGLTLLGLVSGLGLIASRPAHTAGGPVPVTVANVPLATTSADSPAKQPVEFQNTLLRAGSFQTFYTVPAGKRLVIEYVNVVSNILNDPNRYSLIIIHNSVYTNFSLVPDGSPYVGASHKVLLYADAGSQVSGFFQYSGSNPFPAIYDTVTGYLVDTP